MVKKDKKINKTALWHLFKRVCRTRNYLGLFLDNIKTTKTARGRNKLILLLPVPTALHTQITCNIGQCAHSNINVKTRTVTFNSQEHNVHKAI